jgi:hypothetical protein
MTFFRMWLAATIALYLQFGWEANARGLHHSVVDWIVVPAAYAVFAAVLAYVVSGLVENVVASRSHLPTDPHD